MYAKSRFYWIQRKNIGPTQMLFFLRRKWWLTNIRQPRIAMKGWDATCNPYQPKNDSRILEGLFFSHISFRLRHVFLATLSDPEKCIILKMSWKCYVCLITRNQLRATLRYTTCMEKYTSLFCPIFSKNTIYDYRSFI